MSSQFHIYSHEIQHNYEKLVNAYNTLKLKTDKRICTLEAELEDSHRLEENIKNRSCKELHELRRQLFELHEKMERNKNTYEEGINQILATKVCSDQRLSVEKNNNDENCTDNNSSIVDSVSSVTCESCIFHKSQLDELKIKICDLMEEVKKNTEILHRKQKLNETFSRKLEEKDHHLKILASKLHRTLEKNSHIRSILQTANEEKNELCTQLNTKLDEIESLKNRKIEDLKTEHELENKLIIQGEQLKELENQLIIQGDRLKESEESKNINEKTCIDLMIQNEKLQNMVNERNQENAILDETVKKLQDSYRTANDNVIFLQTNLKKCDENLKSSVEENENLKSKSDCVRNKLENFEQLLHESESENNKRKLELETVSNERKRLIDTNDLLCNRIADLELCLAQKCSADVIKMTNSSTSTDSCFCSTGLNSNMCSEHHICSTDFIVSEHHDCTFENEKLKRQLSEHVETIGSIQKKAQNTENELKKQYENKLSQMSMEVQILKNQRKCQNKNVIKQMNVNNIISDEIVTEYPLAHTYSKETYMQITDESSGDTNEKNKIKIKLARQLEKALRENQDVPSNKKKCTLNRSKFQKHNW